MMSRNPVGWIVAFCLVSANAAQAQGLDIDVTRDQRPASSARTEFLFTGDVDGISVVHRRAYDSCCLEFVPRIELDGDVLRIVETDQGPPCGCLYIPWDLTVTLHGLEPGDYDVYLLRESSHPEDMLLATALITVPETVTRFFVRGRVNDDREVDISDAVALLTVLFLEGRNPYPG